jgi:hypothetical protein
MFQGAAPEWQQNEDNDSFLWTNLNDKPELLSEIRNNTATVLKLNK